MENNKYYTPDISEFHIGFEYEVRHQEMQYRFLSLKYATIL